MELNEMELPILVLGEGGAALDPVAAVHVLDGTDAADLGAVDVATDHSVHVARFGEPRHRRLEPRYELHGKLGAVLQVGGDRPVPQAETTPRPVEPQVERKGTVVHSRAHRLERASEMRQSIELMAMNDEKTPSIGCDVDGVSGELHTTEVEADEGFEKLVVVTGYVNDSRPLSLLSQQLLYQGIVIVSP